MRTNFILAAALACAAICGGAARAQSAFFDGAQDPASREVMKKAEADIEKYRKGDFIVVLVDEKGRPVKNADAVIDLFQHQFTFGTNMRHLSDMPESKLRSEALKAITDIFNTVIVCDYWNENTLGKPGAFESAKKDYRWAVDNGLRMRFHAVLYNVPGWIPTDKNLTEKDYWDIIEFRIRDVAANFRGRIPEYDVMNEMFTRKAYCDRIREANPAFPDFSDPAVAKHIFDLARKYLPEGKLVCLEAQPATDKNPLFLTFLDYIKALRDMGGQFDYVGNQMHFFTKGIPFQEGHKVYGPDRFTMVGVNKGFEMLATVGKPVVITEFNGPSRSNAEPEADQNKLWTMTDKENSAWQANFYKLAFSKPYIRELTRWYQVDNMGGRAIDGGIVDANGDRHQIYYDLKKLIKEDWHTRVAGKTGERGQIAMRGFYGDYDINVPGYEPATVKLYDDNKEKTVKVVLTAAKAK